MSKSKIYKFDETLRKNTDSIIVGIDEVGKGSAAGPMLICAISLKPEFYSHKVKDSKLLTVKQIDNIYLLVKQNINLCMLKWINNKEIDNNNIHLLLKKNYQVVVDEISLKYQDHKIVFVCDYYSPTHPSNSIVSLVKAESKSFSVACASIVAKKIRDDLMNFYSFLYTNYSFETNKGYLTLRHIKNILESGTCNIHRIKFLKNINNLQDTKKKRNCI